MEKEVKKNEENAIVNQTKSRTANFFKNAKGRKLTEEQRKRTQTIIKIVSVILFAAIYSLIFIQGLYKEDNEIHWRRIVIPTFLFLFPSAILFVKIQIPEKINTFVSVLFSLFVMKANFVMLQMSQGYQYKNLSIQIEDLNMLIIFMIFIFIYALFNSFKVAIIGLNMITMAFGLTNYYLVQFRGTGFLAVDVLNIETAANVAGGYSYSIDFYVYLLLMSLIAISFLAVKLGKNTMTKKWWRMIPIVLAICVAARFHQTFFATDEFDKVLKVKYFKPQETFTKNGMYASFVKSIKDLMVDPPEGYSVKTVKETAKKYPGKKATVTKEKSPNIIMIMDEAFTDFSSFSDLKISEDCMPYFHSLKENAIKGQMFVSIFGGGTAATEFEALTSNSMGFIPNGITAYSAYINDAMPSLATTLASQNYGGMLAMHPYKGSGYKRNKVYPLLGFDRFITRDDFSADTNRVGRHISDVADVERIISEYENYRKEKSNPFFMFNVTMQNHSPFNSPNVKDSIKLKYDLNIPEADQYVDLMKHTDDALKTLVEYFKKVDEPTIIVFFGDHQPKLENEFYEQIKKSSKLDKVYDELTKRNTQFVIWANYGIKEQEDLYISANYMSSLILDTAGLAKSGYEQFLSEVQKSIPVITKYGYVGKDGNFYQVEDKKSPYYDLIQTYNMLEYNNIFDVKNRVTELFEVK